MILQKEIKKLKKEKKKEDIKKKNKKLKRWIFLKGVFI